MTTYNWTIAALNCKVNENGMQDVVYNVHWRYTATNENDISADMYGMQYVSPPSEEGFTPYGQLTKEQVVGWLEGSMDVHSMNLYLDNQIELIVNPVDITPPLPFEN